MVVNNDRCPNWAEKALQGLTFWIGHRHSLYPKYPLGESALVAEICNLIFANLHPDEVLLCEKQYSRLMPAGQCPHGVQARADIVVITGLSYAEADSRQSLAGNLLAVIEIKRASAPKNQIDEDLKRLAELKRCNPKARALLFVIAEARLPRRFVTAEGKAILGKQNIPRHEGHFRVRRVCKAAASFSGKKSAHYACIIEVFCGSPSNNSPKRTRKRSRVT